MPRYRCKVADGHGKVSFEFRDASDESDLARAIDSSGLFLLSCRVAEPRQMGKKRYKDAVILDVTRTSAVLLQAGLSLENTLEVASGVFESTLSGPLIKDLLDGVRKGDSFSSRLDAMPSSFSPVYRGMVRIGERTGHLEPMFRRLSVYLDERKILRDKIQSALMYPSIVLFVVFAGLLGISIFLVPVLKDLFDQMGSKLPPQTAAALRLMDLISSVAIAMSAVLIVIIPSLAMARRKSKDFAVRIDGFALSIPFLGRYLILRDCLSFAFAMETLVGAGIPMEDSLAEAARVVANRALAADLESARDDVLKGDRLSDSFSRRKSIPREFSRWAAIGEKTGSVETIFAQTRGFFQYSLERWTTRFMALVEPSLVLVVGVILVAIVILFIIPFLTSFTAIR